MTFENLSGVGEDVTVEEVEQALETVRRMESVFETNKNDVYDARRVLEVVYGMEEKSPSKHEMETVMRVLENVDEDEVTSLEPSHVNAVFSSLMVEMRMLQGEC